MKLSVWIFLQCIYGKLRELGLADFLTDDHFFSDLVKRILALAFLPPEMIELQYESEKHRIRDYIDSLNEKIRKDKSPRVDKFFKYYERYWLKIVTPQGYSVYAQSIRTNNCSESFNSILGNYLVEKQQRPRAGFFCRKYFRELWNLNLIFFNLMIK